MNKDAAQQGVAADEAGASDLASPLNSVLARRQASHPDSTALEDGVGRGLRLASSLQRRQQSLATEGSLRNTRHGRPAHGRPVNERLTSLEVPGERRTLAGDISVFDAG
jgi:hypothetical protein